MNLFNKLPGFVRSAPGLEQLVWRRLPAILLWGTLLPLLLAVVNRWLATAIPETGVHDGGLLLWDYTMFGVVVLHWSLVLLSGLPRQGRSLQPNHCCAQSMQQGQRRVA